jgi:hypothetical protein
VNVVCFKWNAPGYRTQFTAEHVNTLAKMVTRHYSKLNRFICVTNDSAGLDADVSIVPDLEDFADIPSPHGGNNPSCFRRLRLFHPDAAEWFGERFVALDIDGVILRDLAPLWDRDEDFVAWRDPSHAHQVNGSMMLIRAGKFPNVWSLFSRAGSLDAMRAGFKGSDQGWISYMLRGRPTWTAADGVHSYKKEVAPHKRAPADARVVFFHGDPKPWDKECQRAQWIREAYK